MGDCYRFVGHFCDCLSPGRLLNVTVALSFSSFPVDCRCFLRGLSPVFWALSHVVPTLLEGLIIISLGCGSVN